MSPAGKCSVLNEPGLHNGRCTVRKHNLSFKILKNKKVEKCTLYTVHCTLYGRVNRFQQDKSRHIVAVAIEVSTVRVIYFKAFLHSELFLPNFSFKVTKCNPTTIFFFLFMYLQGIETWISVV